MPAEAGIHVTGEQGVESCVGPRLRGDDVGVRWWVNTFAQRCDMLHVLSIAIGLVVLVLVAVNVAIFLYACYEYSTSSRKEPWLRSTQVLLAGPGAARPSVILLHGFGGTPRDLRSIAEPLAERGYRVVVPAIPEQTSTSFAYRRGLPPEADFVLDARVLPNPHWDARLRPLSGRDAGVRDYLEAQPEVAAYVVQVQGFLDTWLPKLRSETRSYVTVAFGCTGGRHRSVFLAERLARHCRESGWAEVAVHHRELD